MVAASLTAAEKIRDRTTLYSTIVIAVGIMATTLGQPGFCWRWIPIRNLLKNELHVDRAANAAFFFWSGSPPGTSSRSSGSSPTPSRSLAAVAKPICWQAAFWPHWPGSDSISRPTPTRGAALGRDRHQHIHGDHQHGGGSLYLVETAQAIGGSGRLTSIREFVAQSSPDHQWSGVRLSCLHRIRLDSGSQRRNRLFFSCRSRSFSCMSRDGQCCRPPCWKPPRHSSSELARRARSGRRRR